jgi:hypothetical protein
MWRPSGIALALQGSNITIWRACPLPVERRQCSGGNAFALQWGNPDAKHADIT